MKKLALMATNLWLSYLLVSLQLVGSIVLILWTFEAVHAGDFFCPSGNVTCLIASINTANGLPGTHTINLEPGTYTLQTIDNGDLACDNGLCTFDPNGLPVISGSIRIQGSADDAPTVIERDPGAPSFRIFQVSIGGELVLDGMTIQRGGGPNLIIGPAIVNHGVTSLWNSIVTEMRGEGGAILNDGTLNVFRSLITDNFMGHVSGGILNEAEGNLFVENSTIARNASDGAGGIGNEGSLVVRNSAIISNRSASTFAAGGGILNSGFAEIVNSTIAKNIAGTTAGGILNFGGGHILITNSTVRENQITPLVNTGSGIANSGGILRLQNTIVAGNSFTPFSLGPDCLGTIQSLGNNLIGDPSGCEINLQPSDLTGDPGLGELTETAEEDLPGTAYYPVLAGSVVINRGNAAACPETDQLGNPRVGTCDIGAVEFQGRMLVSVDVRPKKDANRINPNSSKNINVAIFSLDGFDTTTVDPNSVRFGATGTEAAPIHVALRDVNGDGHFDMVLRFQIQDIGIKCGDTSASLTGQTSNGVSFIGSSPIKTVLCKSSKVSPS